MTTKTNITLLPCPFCGGEAEMDTRQGYLALGTGRLGNRIAAYCRSCNADMGVCVEDVPDIEPEQVADMWNRRAAVEADRADHLRGVTKMIPSDAGIMEIWRPYRHFPPDWICGFARALLSRYGSGRPAASAEPAKDKAPVLRIAGCIVRNLDMPLTQSRVLAAAREIAEFAAPVAQEPVAEVLSSRKGNDTSTIDKALPDGTKLYAWPVAAQAQHPDDAAVDRFAAAMKTKLAQKRAEGRGGWEDKAQCSQDRLSLMLRGHVAKGDPVDVGNFCMMLHQRGERISGRDAASPSAQDLEDAAALRAILMESPEAVSYPNESWTEAYAEWRAVAIDAARAAKGADHG